MTDPTSIGKRRHHGVHYAAVTIFLLLAAVQSHKPLNLDNADLPVWAKAVADTGKPIAYRGELRPHDKFVYHPPLYLYALGGWFRLFGYGPSQIRMFGAVCAILLGWICLEFIRTLFGVADFHRVGILFWPVFLLNPYTLQVSGIADIDSTIYGPLLCGFVLAVIRLMWREGEPLAEQPRIGRLALCGVILSLCFWAKLTTVALLLPFTLVLFLFRFGVKRSLRPAATIIGIGVGAFVITYWIWCEWMGVRATTVLNLLSSYPTSASLPSVSDRLRAACSTSIFMGPFIMKWTGPIPWVAAAIVGMFCFFRARKGDERAYVLGATIGLAFLATGAYAALRMTFGNSPYKYAFVFWGLIALCLAVLANNAGRLLSKASALHTEYLSKHSPSGPALAWAAVVAALVFATAFIRLGDKPIRGWFSEYAHLTLAPALVALAVAILAWRSGRPPLTSMALLLMTAYQMGLGAAIAFFQVRQPYSTSYNYGQMGLAETAAYIRSVSHPADFIMCMKDLGPMAERRYFENYGYVYGGEHGAAQAIELLSGKVRFAIFTEQLGEDQLIMNPPLLKWVRANCRLVKSIGNYRIYERM